MDDDLTQDEEIRRKEVTEASRVFKDPMLLSLIAHAKEQPKCPLTLIVGGIVVSGELVTTADYLRLCENSESAEQAELDANKSLSDMADSLDSKYENASPNERFDSDISVEYIHLSNARLFIPGSVPFPPMESPGVLWRVRLRSVDGHSIGAIG